MSLFLFSGASFALPITVLHNFDGTTEGGQPIAALVLGSDGNLYGTTSAGGPDPCSCGTVFKMNTNGVRALLHVFNGADGASPQGALVQGTDGNFYGTTSAGGANNTGTVFRISNTGIFSSLHSFAPLPAGVYQNDDGATPVAGLAQGPDGNFYGTALVGGIGGGTLFRITPAGAFTVLHNFLYEEGSLPKGGVVFGNDGNLYGTTIFYGQDAQHPDGGQGTVFRIATDGSQFTVLHIFGGPDGGYANQLVRGADGNFYGTTAYYGANESGSVFRITPAGQLTSLYSFTNGLDGSGPQDALVQGVDGNFYSTTRFGGASGGGTVFKITPDGVLTTLHALGGPGEGFWPTATLARAKDGNFYGVTQYGGTSDQGTMFRIAGPVASKLSWIAPTPAQDKVFNLTITRPFSVALRAKTASALETVHIGSVPTGAGIPYGAVIDSVDGNPANASLQWTPGAGQAGDFFVTFFADNVNAPSARPLTRTLRFHVVKRGTALATTASVLDTGTPALRLNLHATFTATLPSEPIAGKNLRFETSDGTLLCAATTDATGQATCGTLGTVVTTVINRGYYARFAGDDAYNAAAKYGYVIGNK